MPRCPGFYFSNLTTVSRDSIFAASALVAFCSGLKVLSSNPLMMPFSTAIWIALSAQVGIVSLSAKVTVAPLASFLSALWVWALVLSLVSVTLVGGSVSYAAGSRAETEATRLASLDGGA